MQQPNINPARRCLSASTPRDARRRRYRFTPRASARRRRRRRRAPAAAPLLRHCCATAAPLLRLCCATAVPLLRHDWPAAPLTQCAATASPLCVRHYYTTTTPALSVRNCCATTTRNTIYRYETETETETHATRATRLHTPELAPQRYCLATASQSLCAPASQLPTEQAGCQTANLIVLVPPVRQPIRSATKLFGNLSHFLLNLTWG